MNPTPHTQASDSHHPSIKDLIGLTLQESGVYPYPEFVKPLEALFDQFATRRVIEELERLPVDSTYVGIGYMQSVEKGVVDARIATLQSTLTEAKDKEGTE